MSPHRILTILAFALAASALPAAATVWLRDDIGGPYNAYASRFKRLSAAGESVAIDGICDSACTLALIYFPRDRICVTSRARLGFHVAVLVPDSGGQPSVEWNVTQRTLARYPKPIRDWISRQGGLSTRMIYLQGAELARLYRACAR